MDQPSVYVVATYPKWKPPWRRKRRINMSIYGPFMPGFAAAVQVRPHHPEWLAGAIRWALKEIGGASAPGSK